MNPDRGEDETELRKQSFDLKTVRIPCNMHPNVFQLHYVSVSFLKEEKNIIPHIDVLN